MNYLKIIRPINLIIVAVTQLLFWFYLFIPDFESNNITPLLSNDKLEWFIVMTILITAAGYVINDLLDVPTDSVNKGKKLIVSKSLSVKEAKAYYLALSVFALLIASYLTYTTGQFNFLVVFALTTLALYFYSKRLKSSVIFGNILVSILVALVPFIFIFIENNAFNQLKIENLDQYLTSFLILTAFSTFAFVANFIRELVKDCEDIEGDRSANITTLATSFGVKKVEAICTYISYFLLVICLVWAIRIQIWLSTIELVFFVIGILAPIVFVILNLRKDEHTKAKYQFLSNSLKVLMASGLFYLFIHLNT